MYISQRGLVHVVSILYKIFLTYTSETSSQRADVDVIRTLVVGDTVAVGVVVGGRMCRYIVVVVLRRSGFVIHQLLG